MEPCYSVRVTFRHNKARIYITVNECELIWVIDRDCIGDRERMNVFIDNIIKGNKDSIKVTEHNDECFLITRKGKIGYISGFSGESWCKIRVPGFWLYDSLNLIASKIPIHKY